MIFSKEPKIKDDNSQEELNKDRVEQTMKDINSLEIKSPRTSEKLDSKQTLERSNSSPKQAYLLIFFGLLFSLVMLIGIGFAVGLVKNPLENNQAIPSVSPAQIPISPSATPRATNSASLVPKEEIKIQILNGSGVAGQATKVKDILKKIDFSKIEVGNLKREETKKTEVIFSSRIIKEQKEEIIAELEKIMTEVLSQNATSSSEFDVIIITGEEKK